MDAFTISLCKWQQNIANSETIHDDQARWLLKLDLHSESKQTYKKLRCRNQQLVNQTRFHTFIAGRIPDSTAANESDLDNKLLNNSSLVSAPVFFVFGEAIRDVPSLNADVVLILSAYVENLRGNANDVSFGESRLPAPVMPFEPRDKDDVELEEKCSENPNEISWFEETSFVRKFS